MIEAILAGRPSVAESNWKSTAHTLFGASAFGASGAVEEPRRLRRLRTGTRRPSSRQSRWILPLEVLEPFGVISLQTAELVSPAEVGLLGHPELPADIGDVLALAQHPIGLSQLAHDLLRGMRFLVVMHRAFQSTFVDIQTLTRPGSTDRGHATPAAKRASSPSRRLRDCSVSGSAYGTPFR
jgi:hypothetical protein